MRSSSDISSNVRGGDALSSYLCDYIQCLILFHKVSIYLYAVHSIVQDSVYTEEKPASIIVTSK